MELSHQLIGRSSTKLVAGLGKTGFAVIDYLKQQGFAVKAADTRLNPPYLEQIKQKWPNLPIHLGEIPHQWCEEVDEIIVSPGLRSDRPEFQHARSQGVSVIGDITLFLRACTAPIIAVTGSNGKSTLVDMLGFIAKRLGYQAEVLGNIGVPAITAVGREFDIVILELSSFQLELIPALNAKIALILNITPDHMDRYENMQDYWAAKQRIFIGSDSVVVNRDDPLTIPKQFAGSEVVRFGLSSPDTKDFGLLTINDQQYLALGVQPLAPVDVLKIKGSHNVSNVLAALAVAQMMRWSLDKVIACLPDYPGLPHRCQWVANVQGASWYNDSKSTNTGSAIAGIMGLKQAGRRILWIAGGDAKEADFSSLARSVKTDVNVAFLYGQDRSLIAEALAAESFTDFEQFETLPMAVQAAASVSMQDDIVLFSPACASFDQFDGFEHRGQVFSELVVGLTDEGKG